MRDSRHSTEPVAAAWFHDLRCGENCSCLCCLGVMIPGGSWNGENCSSVKQQCGRPKSISCLENATGSSSFLRRVENPQSLGAVAGLVAAVGPERALQLVCSKNPLWVSSVFFLSSGSNKRLESVAAVVWTMKPAGSLRFLRSRVHSGRPDASSAHELVVILLAVLLPCVVMLLHGAEAAAATGPVSSSSLSSDGLALLEFKNGLKTSPAGNFSLQSWNASDTTPCNSWEGVLCTSDGRVSSLDLFSFGLEGPISSSLGELQELRQLNLSMNSFSGSIPPELGNCSKLITLDLSSNTLSGTIPPALGKLQALEQLYLSQNSLSGSIPPQLAACSMLQILELSTNQLTGSIPPQLAACSMLQILDLGTNQLTGSIPRGIYNITTLGGFYVNTNNLTGDITEGLIFDISPLELAAIGDWSFFFPLGLACNWGLIFLPILSLLAIWDWSLLSCAVGCCRFGAFGKADTGLWHLDVQQQFLRDNPSRNQTSFSFANIGPQFSNQSKWWRRRWQQQQQQLGRLHTQRAWGATKPDNIRYPQQQFHGEHSTWAWQYVKLTIPLHCHQQAHRFPTTRAWQFDQSFAVILQLESDLRPNSHRAGKSPEPKRDHSL